MIFNAVGKKNKIHSFCCSVLIQSWGTTCISQPGVWTGSSSGAWEQQENEHSKRHSHRSTCAVQVTATALRLLTQSCQTEQQVTGKGKD